jgi:hypothetical protein
MARKRIPLCVIALVAAAWLAGASAECAETDLVQNGDFSQIVDGRPAGWVTSGDPTSVSQELTTAYDAGNPCAKLTCTRVEGRGFRNRPTVAQRGSLQLADGGYYELSCRLRGEGLGQEVSVAIVHPAQRRGWAMRQGFPVGEAWQEHRVAFVATRPIGETGEIQFSFSGMGTLYLDDVRLTALDQTKIVFTNTVPEGGGKNLVPNGSFELGMIGWGAVGRHIAWGNLDRLQGRIEASGGTHGSSFLRIPLGGRNGPILYWDYYVPPARRVGTMLAANLGWIPVETGRPYTLSCDIRSSSAGGAQALLGVRCEDPRGGGLPAGHDLRKLVSLTNQWQRFSFTFRPESRYVYVTVGPDVDNSEIWVVDVDAIQLEAGEEATPFEPYRQAEVGIEPSEAGGIFVAGEPAFLRLKAANSGEAPAVVTATFEVTDFFDNPAELPAQSLNVPAGGVAEQDVPLPADWKGYYRLRAVYGLPDGAAEQRLRLAVVPPRREADSVLGVNHAFPDDYLIRQAKKAGCAWYRDWSLKWDDLEPSPGEYNWHVGDVQVDRVLKEGVHLMALLPPYPSASWNTTGPESARDMFRNQHPWDLAWPPEDPQKLGEFIENAVAHYKDRVHVWEFLNEPIFTHYAPADYVRLLAIAYPAMHRADPGCRVIGGIGSSPDRLTGEVIEAGCLDYVDTFVLHTYPGRMPPERFLPQMDELLQLMDEHGGRKPIWVTEFSYFANDDPPADPFIGSGAWPEDRLLADERQGAEYTVRLFAVLMARGVEKVFVHAGIGGEVNKPYYDCPFFKYGGAPAKVLPALAVYTDLMGSKARFAGEGDLGEGAYCMAFETGTQAVLVLWRGEGETRIFVPDGVTCLDFMGCTLPDGPAVISSTPIYLVGPPGRAKALAEAVRPAGN